MQPENQQTQAEPMSLGLFRGGVAGWVRPARGRPSPGGACSSGPQMGLANVAVPSAQFCPAAWVTGLTSFFRDATRSYWRIGHGGARSRVASGLLSVGWRPLLTSQFAFQPGLRIC